MITVTGDDERYEVAGDRSAPLQHLEAAHPGHSDVCNDHVYPVILEVVQTLIAVVCDCCLMAFFVQLALDAITQVLLIIYHQNVVPEGLLRHSRPLLLDAEYGCVELRERDWLRQIIHCAQT